MGRLGRLSLLVTHLGEAYFFAGRPAEAASQAERALVLATERGERGNQVYAHRLIGLVASEQELAKAEMARHHLTEALALAGKLGMRPLAARCHLALGRLLRRLGDLAGARPHLATARELLEAMQMRYWLDRLRLEKVGPD
jgi:tetratricopeptide (TPR) repeat protein